MEVVIYRHGEFIYPFVVLIQKRCAKQMAIIDEERALGLPPSSKRKRRAAAVPAQVPTPSTSNDGQQQQQQQQQQQMQVDPCDKCGRVHEPDSKNKSYRCNLCCKLFVSLKTLNLHRDMHYGSSVKNVVCPYCGLCFQRLEALHQHVKHAHKTSYTPGKHKCHDCPLSFNKYHHMIEHRAVHRVRPEGSEDFPWERDPNQDPPWIRRDDAGNVTVEEGMEEVFVEYKHVMIDGHDTNGRVQGFYNYFLNGFNGDISKLKSHLIEIFKAEDRAFRISLSFGLVLKDVETGKYKYYTAWLNNLSTNLFRISIKEDVYDYLNVLESGNLLERMMSRSHSSKWKLQFVSNVTYIVFRTEYPIGAARGVELPQYLVDCRSIRCLNKNENRVLYKDRLCAFRCIAAQEGTNDMRDRTKRLYTQWRDHQIEEGVDEEELPENSEDFKGIRIADLPQFEECFNVRLNVFSLNPDQSCVKVYTTITDSHDDVTTSLDLNLYESHFSLITNMASYAKNYRCHFCGRSFPRATDLKVHEKICCSRVRYVYPGGLYKSPLTIFEEIKLTLGIEVPKELQVYPYFAVYDFEALLEKVGTGEEEEGRSIWTAKHVPICVSVCSNVPGYTAPYAITDDDPDNLVKSMCDRLELIQKQAEKDMLERWAALMTDLNDMFNDFPKEVHDMLIKEANAKPDPHHPRHSEDRPYTTTESDDEGDEEEGEAEERESVVPIEGHQVCQEDDDVPELVDAPRMGSMAHLEAQRRHAKNVQRIIEKLNVYISVLPVLGYNSSRYDLNLIKQYFPKHFNLTNELKYVIKKTNQYTAIATTKFKFLDMSNYLAAGSSYSRFLAAYGVAETKSFFPYEFFERADQLTSVTALPAKSAFFSSLKNANVLDVEHAEWERAGKRGPEPKTGQENYDALLVVWEQRGMKNLGDFLEYYVNLDTGPFVTAAQRLLNNYHEDGVDVFKIAVSAPGVARKLLFDNSNDQRKFFGSFGPDDADLYWKLKACSFGGPSIIYKRYMKVGESRIRGNPDKIAQNIVGYDSNSLYLHALSKELPVLFPIRRRAERGFYPEVKWSNTDMYHWMEYVAKQEGIKIQHKLRSGMEFPVGPYRLDGYSTDGGKRRGFEFNGCYYHGHDPSLCTFLKYDTMSEKTKQLMEKRRKNTSERASFIKDMNIQLTVIYECEFDRMKKDDPEVNRILEMFMPYFYLDYPKAVTENDILESIVEDDTSEHVDHIRRLRGMVQVDIEVPWLWEHNFFPGAAYGESPQQHFGEMSPIFCNGTVEFERWGETMQNYARENDLSLKGRNLLLGGTKAEKIYLSTDLLRWYMQHGLKVTKVHEVIEYKFAACFSDFRDKICARRREGDTDPSKSVLSETAKVLGNAAYGSLLLDKTKHTNVKYVHSKHKAHLAVNDPSFKNLTELPGELYEVEMSKKMTVLDLPIQLAFCILQNAKLEMLKFYYDFLCKYVDKADFQLTHMDTDSYYFAISAPQLSDVIRPSYRRWWFKGLHSRDACKDDVNRWDTPMEWFPRECCPTHRRYDKRVPGLFKLEASGSELIALASKTYYLAKWEGGDSVKAKGVQQRAIGDARPLYENALFDRKTGYATNVGLRAQQNTVMTYSQRKKGFSFFYVKRIIQPDGVCTMPHTWEMSPFPDYGVLVLHSKNCLSNDFMRTLCWNGDVFWSVTQAFLYEKARLNGRPELAVVIHAASSVRAVHRAAARIRPVDTWYGEREGIMRGLVEKKIDGLKEDIIHALRQSEGRRIVQPGHACNSYFTCGYYRGLAEVTDPKSYPGHDYMSYFWEEKLHNAQFMDGLA